MSFLKSGYKQSLKKKEKETKRHIKEFYKILHELDVVATKIKKDYPKRKKFTEKFLTKHVDKYTDRVINKMEMNVLLSKLLTNET